MAGAGAALLPSVAEAQVSSGNVIELFIDQVDAEMIDGTFVFSLMFFDAIEEGRPVVRVTEGEGVTISVTNLDTRPHGFAISGIPTASIADIPPGATAEVSFVAPVGGSYMYYDPTLAPLNRILGLYGAFLVTPVEGRTLKGSPTPYSRATHTPAITALFDALGTTTRFKGGKWNPSDPARDKLWIFSQVDPNLNARVEAGELVPPASIVPSFVPRYFTINGLSGYDTAIHDVGSDVDWTRGAGLIMPRGRQGQPTLIRTMNAGLATHSPHIHGNHVMEMTETNLATGEMKIESNIYELDAWMMAPMMRKDMLLPFEKPGDAAVWPPKQEPFPLRYVMHCHTEMSQTAGGGNYPQGLVTHWEMTGAI